MINSLWFATRRLRALLPSLIYLPLVLVVGAELFKATMGAIDPFTGFKVYSVSVPNHCVEENPIVHVTRSSKQAARGSYLARIEPVSGGASASAYQSPWFDYKPRSDFFFTTDLPTYFGGGLPLHLRPGTYYGEIQWTFRRPWRSDDFIVAKTAPFEVWSVADQRCTKRNTINTGGPR